MSGSAPSRTSAVSRPSAGSGLRPGCRRCRGRASGHARPRRPEPRPALVEADPPGQQPGGQPHVERPEHVAAAQRGQEPGLRQAWASTPGRLGHRRALGQRRPAQHDDDAVTVGRRLARRRAVARPSAAATLGVAPAPVAAASPPGRAADRRRRRAAGHRGGASGVSGVGRGDSSMSAGRVDHRVAQPQEEDGQLLRRSPASSDQARAARLVDRGPRQAEHQLGRQPVAQLGVDLVGADDALGQLGPGVGRLVGQPGAADDADRPGPPASAAAAIPAAAAASASPQLTATSSPSCGPCGTMAHRSRRIGSTASARRLVGEAALVAQPAVVDRVRVDAEQPGEPVGRGLHRHPAADRARSCRSTRPGRGPRGGP